MLNRSGPGRWRATVRCGLTLVGAVALLPTVAGCMSSRGNSGARPARTYTANYAQLYDNPTYVDSSDNPNEYQKTIRELQMIQRDLEQNTNPSAKKRSFWDWFKPKPKADEPARARSAPPPLADPADSGPPKM